MLRLKTHASSVFRVAIAGILSISLLAPIVMSKATNAAQVTNRYIKMSNSAASATGVTYEIGFTPTSTSVESLVIDFCSDTPILGTTCTVNAGVTTPSFGSAATPGGGTGTIGSWTSSTFTASTVQMNGSANTTATAQVFTITGVQNPSVAGTFYARITTYANNSYGTYTSALLPGNYVDNGGIALSTATTLSVTAKVQETLVFCVSKVNPGIACTATSAPNLALGHGGNIVLDNTAVDVDTAYFQVSTNASGNVVVRIKGGVLATGGGPTIPTTPAGSSTNFAITAGTADFGMRIGTSAGADYSNNGSITIDSNYSHASQYGWDVTTAGNNTTSTYGDVIATVQASQNTFAMLNFAATASLTTPAGLYSATENLIATGTY